MDSFLLTERMPDSVLAPHDLKLELGEMARTIRAFVAKEVLPRSEAIEAADFETTLRLVRWAGDLGVLSTSVPEEYGGLGLGKAAAAYVDESLCGQVSFQTICGVHSSLGTLPIVYAGTPQQRERLLPDLATARRIGAYALTEPSSGSDAMSLRTAAVPTGDGTAYILNGSKQFISNARFADLFTVFARVPDAGVTAFLVEREMSGLSIGREEDTMGIRGASAAALVLEDVRVPAENMLGGLGEGHKLAFNILNHGRLKLAVQAVGNAKRVFDLALAHAGDREQFGRPICEFGAIREKLAVMAAAIRAVESAAYRTLGDLDAFIERNPQLGHSAPMAAGEAYRVECSLVKVLASEMLDLVVDEAVQCFGGYGFSAEYPVERHYRDSRVNRIFEGTSEINRVFAASILIRRAERGMLTAGGPAEGDPRAARRLKSLTLAAVEVVRHDSRRLLPEGQSLLLRVADLAMLAYLSESAVLRAAKAQSDGAADAELLVAMARFTAEHARWAADRAAAELLATAQPGGPRELLAAALASCRAQPAVDSISLCEEIVAVLLARRGPTL